MRRMEIRQWKSIGSFNITNKQEENLCRLIHLWTSAMNTQTHDVATNELRYDASSMEENPFSIFIHSVFLFFFFIFFADYFRYKMKREKNGGEWKFELSQKFPIESGIFLFSIAAAAAYSIIPTKSLDRLITFHSRSTWLLFVICFVVIRNGPRYTCFFFSVAPSRCYTIK